MAMSKSKIENELVDVYITRMPADAPIGRAACRERDDEISSVTNEKVKREKYFVWRLLCYALERSLGMCGKEMNFTKESYGGWSVNGAEISLSHSDGALAVAVSRAPVGIDIERIHATRAERIAERIMTEAELSEFESVPPDMRDERLIEIWTAKEAVFKSKKADAFIPKDHDTLSESFKTDSIMIGTEKFAWSVATATPERVRLFTDIDLTKN